MADDEHTLRDALASQHSHTVDQQRSDSHYHNAALYNHLSHPHYRMHTPLTIPVHYLSHPTSTLLLYPLPSGCFCLHLLSVPPSLPSHSSFL